MTNNKHHFYLLFPNIFGFKGGVQVYSAFLLQALQQLYPEANYNVFLKYDKPTQLRSQFLPQTNFHCLGKLPQLLQSILLTFQLISRGIRQQPTLIITTHVNYSIPCYWLQRITGVPYWVVVHGLEAWNLQNPLLQTALGHADQVIAVSNYTRDRLLKEQPLNPAKVSVLPNTFVAKRFQPNLKPHYLLQRYGLTPEQPIILTVARLAQYKGYEQVFHALREVRHHLPNVHYILGGKGNYPWIKSVVEKLNLQECVTLAGFIPDEELGDHYNLCDVFAMPSQGEGFGIVYLEALACGKPVLAGNQDGAVDPLLQGKLGCLVDPTDVNAIASNLIQILQGTHPNPLLFQPQILRQQTITRFEFTQFRQTLAQLIQKQLIHQFQGLDMNSDDSADDSAVGWCNQGKSSTMSQKSTPFEAILNRN